MKRVKVDFSTTVKGGLIRANQRRASESLVVGDEVEAYDPAEGMEFVGVVDHLSDDGQFAFLRMEWDDNTPVQRNRPGLNLVVASWSPVAQPLGDTWGEGPSVSAPEASPPLVAAAHPTPA
jgi:hypothetical protein